MISEKPHYVNFEFGSMYHLYTRVSGKENIFQQERNYIFFFQKLSFYLLPYLEIHAYCLVPQRFSLLITFRSRKDILDILKLNDDLKNNKIHQFLMQPVSNLLNSYSKSYNKMYGRKGALFIDYIKRDKIENEEDLKIIFRKIHQIPIENMVSQSLSEWKYSSYNSYLNLDRPSKLSREKIMNLFEGREDFVSFHK